MVPADIKPDLADASVPVGDLTWVNEIIWGTPVGVTVGRERPSGVTALAEFVALPNAHHAHLLIPIDSPPAAQRALETYVDARRTIRAGAALLAMAVRARIIPPLGGRVHVSAVAGQTGAGNGTPSLTAYLSGVLGCDEVKIAVRMGGRRPNRKPVLQVLTPDGAVLAYVKVGWNDLTRSLVRNEAQVLRTFAESAWQPTSFVWPRLRHSGTCGELEIIVMAPVPPGPWFRRVASHVELATLVREIARMAPETREELGASAYWRQTMCRLALLADSIRPSRLEVLQGLVSRLEDRYGAVELAFGGSHGDLTRWNMARRESKLVIFDWERSGSKAPVGMDAAHFDFDLAVKFHRNSPPYAVRSLLAGDGGVLPHFTSKAVPARLLLALDLLEMVLRYEEARSAGLDVPDTLYFGAFRSAVLSAGVG